MLLQAKNALLILRKLKKGKATISALTKEITNKNSVSLSVARKDVSVFLTKLKNMNLINE
jgi:DNA-binding HxlR family transcriptional regulator